MLFEFGWTIVSHDLVVRHAIRAPATRASVRQLERLKEYECPLILTEMAELGYLHKSNTISMTALNLREDIQDALLGQSVREARVRTRARCASDSELPHKSDRHPQQPLTTMTTASK